MPEPSPPFAPHRPFRCCNLIPSVDSGLGIENGTENWKTALYFSPFFTYDLSRLRLAERLGEPDSTQPGAVQIELYWHGMRDYLDQTKKAERGSNEQRYPNFAKLYGELFPDLREQIEEFRSDRLALEIKKKWNYDVSSDGAVDKLGSNLVHTEIDIVLVLSIPMPAFRAVQR